MCHITHPKAIIYLSSANAEDAAAQLIKRKLGYEASTYYRSSARTFPLRHRDTYFSVSHTAEITAVAFARFPVGLDIEHRINTEAAPDLSWALSKYELTEISNRNNDRLTEIWASKEASGKAVGTGLAFAPYRIRTRPFLRASGRRHAEVPLPDAGFAIVSTYGWWLGDYHLCLAWNLTYEKKDCGSSRRTL